MLFLVLGLRLISLRKAKTSENVEVKKGTVSEELILSGDVKADKYTSLAFQLSGELAWVGVSEGQSVKSGQALAKLNTVNLSADLQRVRSDLRDAEATLARVYDEVKNHSSDETLTQRETRTGAEVAKDKAYDAVTKAEENLRNATLFAPFSGIVAYAAHTSSGVNIIFSEKQFEIVDSSTIYFEVTAEQTEIIQLSEKQKVNIILDSFPEEELQGEIFYLGLTPKPDETGTVYKVRINFLEKPGNNKIRVGMTGEARIILSQKENVLYIPPKFLKSDTRGKYVKLGSKNHKVYVQTGIEGEDKVEIIDKIKEGDRVYD